MPTDHVIHIRAKDFAAVVGQALRDDTEMCREVAYDLAIQGEALAVRNTDKAQLVDLGEYKRGWEHSRVPDGAAFGNTAPHAAVIENGRRPGRPGPPYQPIFEWVTRKLFDAYDPVEDEVEAERLAWAIRAQIHQDGTAPRTILGDTTTVLQGRVKPAMVRALTRRHRK